MNLRKTLFTLIFLAVTLHFVNVSVAVAQDYYYNAADQLIDSFDRDTRSKGADWIAKPVTQIQTIRDANHEFDMGPTHRGSLGRKIVENLTDLQYRVTRLAETEPPFKNEYWNNSVPGLYVDLLTGDVLFSSTDKYDSKTGWPSFVKPFDQSKIRLQREPRIEGALEVRSTASKAHLGHLFNDGPQPTGQRYCINSASMRFIALERLQDEGYEDFLYLFDSRYVVDRLPGTNPGLRESISGSSRIGSSGNASNMNLVSKLKTEDVEHISQTKSESGCVWTQGCRLAKNHCGSCLLEKSVARPITSNGSR